MSNLDSDIGTTEINSASDNDNISSPQPKKPKTKYYAYDKLTLARAIHYKHNNLNISWNEVAITSGSTSNAYGSV